MSKLPARDDFFKCLNTKFRIFFHAEKTTEVDLVEVSEIRRKPRYETFSLVFLAPKTILPEQKIYRVEHDVLGNLELFLAPFEENEKGFSFEVLFNQKITDAND